MNIYDYIINTKDNEFDEITTLDALIFARLSYIHFEKIMGKLPIIITDLFNYLEDIHTNRYDKKLIRLLKESKRFKNMAITRCKHISDLEKEEEFTAITINLPNKDKFISFRGTSKKLYDFKEDMNMSFKEIPSSFDAQKYLDEEKKYRYLYIGGHSKGGHLAVFAASHVGYFKRQRIIKIYNFDGPGFLKIDNLIKQIKDKVINYFPEGSIVGRIMFNPALITPIKTKKDGVEAHNLYNWTVENNDLVIGKFKSKSNEFHNTCLKLLEILSEEKREIIIDYFFSLIIHGEIKNIKDLNLGKIRLIINKMPHLKKEEKELLMQFFKVLIKCAIPSIARKNIISRRVKNNKIIKTRVKKITIVKK